MSIKFDFEKAIKDLRSGQDLGGKDGILTPLIKQLIEAALQAELDLHLSDKKQDNRKNGSTVKQLKPVLVVLFWIHQETVTAHLNLN